MNARKGALVVLVLFLVSQYVSFRFITRSSDLLDFSPSPNNNGESPRLSLNERGPPPSVNAKFRYSFDGEVKHNHRTFTVYVWNYSPHASGGTESIQTFHDTINRVGYQSVLFGHLIKQFQTEYTQYIGTEQEIIWSKVSTRDVFVKPEGRLFSEQLARHIRSRRARMVTLAVGHTKPLLTQVVNSQYSMICKNSYFVNMYRCPLTAVVNTPLSKSFIEESLTTSDWEKEDIVLYDNDFQMSLDSLPRSTKLAKFVKIVDFTRAQLIDMYKKAKVIVDLSIPGQERDVFEGAVFDAVPIIGYHGCGRSDDVFPLPRKYKIRHNDWNALDEVIVHALVNRDQALRDTVGVKENAYKYFNDFATSVNRYFSHNILFVTSAFTLEEMDAVYPWIISVLSMHPFASVHVYVNQFRYRDQLQFFELQYAPLYTILERQGWLQQVRFIKVEADKSAPLGFAPQLFGVRRFFCYISVDTLFLNDEFFPTYVDALRKNNMSIIVSKGPAKVDFVFLDGWKWKNHASLFELNGAVSSIVPNPEWPSVREYVTFLRGMIVLGGDELKYYHRLTKHPIWNDASMHFSEYYGDLIGGIQDRTMNRQKAVVKVETNETRNGVPMCAEAVNFVVRFLVFTRHESGIMRARMVKDTLKDVHGFKDVEVWEGSQRLRKFKGHIHICVCTKLCYEKIVRYCHARGARVVWDLIDWPFALKEQWHHSVDVYMTNCLMHKQVLEFMGFKHVVVVEHQHTNDGWFVEGNLQKQKSRPKVVAIVSGGRENVPNAEFLAEIKTECTKLNLEFRVIIANFITKNCTDAARRQKDQSKVWIAVQQCHHSITRDVDIALLWPPNFDFFTINVRPSTRLLFWMSNAVPVIFYPYAAYMDVARKVGYESMTASNVEEIGEALQLLVSNPSLRLDLIDKGLKAAKLFTLANVAKRFATTFCYAQSLSPSLPKG